VDANASFVAMLRGTREQVLNRTPADLKLWPDSLGVAAILQDLRNQASVRDRPCQIRTLTGELRDTLISVEPFDLGSGPHLLLIAQDITEQLKLETQLRQSQKMEAVGQLAAGVAHDFNNILTAINGHTSLLQQQLGGDAFQTRSLTVISLAADRAARLVRQLLTFSRKQVFKPLPIHLNQVAMNLQDMLLRTLGDHIELKVISVANLPTIKADVSMMEQVILNLCVNARDAMPRGGKVIMELSTVEMAIEVARQRGLSRQGQYVHLAVSDSGCGISAEHLPRIFDPFFTTKDVGKGTGLGLATVYGIIQQHRGCIEVESIVDVGTTFHVYLPASDEAVIQTVSQEAPIHKNDAGSACILIVEDEDMVRSIATATLRRKGYRMLEASSGVEALKLFRDHIEHIDLLFTDVMMPGNMLGDELANQVRELRPTIPILFTSGYSPDVAQLQLLSNSSFLPKPFTTAQLLQSIQRCLDRARNGGGSDTTFFKPS
jgi:signal transduction histidine kinase/ActR/RegA family two-component response regulator